MPPKSSKCNQHAEHLKVQGNELFQQNQYQAAHRKYTEAIKADPTNAIYYANRAASSLAMKEYLDAAADAGKATELDPNYAKAWSRLATATQYLAAYTKSVNAWETALKCLPPAEQSNETDKKMRAQFTAGLAAAKKARDVPFQQEKYTYSVSTTTQLPWQKAAALEPQYTAQQKLSSAYVILHAYNEFKEGVDSMKKLQKTFVDGKPRYYGRAGVLGDISNAVLQDKRVMHIDCEDWINKFNEQVIFEAELYKAWSHGGAVTIKEEAPRRLRREGWDKLRPTISTTVHAWLMCGVLAGLTGKHATSMEYHARVVDVLEWGERTWRNVPEAQRGVIFSKTFMRGARRMKLAAMHVCVATNVEDVSGDDMVDYARLLIAETDANPPTPTDGVLDFSFAAAFWMYPKGDAFSSLGWHYMQIGLHATTSEDAQAAFSQSADYYIRSAESYPTDEEQTVMFYKVALEAYWLSPEGVKQADMVPLLILIYTYYPHVLKIWEHSANARQRDEGVVQALDFLKRINDALASGQITHDTMVKPKEFEDKIKWKTNQFVYI